MTRGGAAPAHFGGRAPCTSASVHRRVTSRSGADAGRGGPAAPASHRATHRRQLDPPVADDRPADQLGVDALRDDHVDVTDDRAEVRLDHLGVRAQRPQVDPDVADPARSACLRSRSAALRHAIRLLRHPELEDDYAAAWEEWRASGEAADWESTVDDGLGDAAR